MATLFMQNKKGFLSFLGLLITLMIIAWLAYKMFNAYYGNAKRPVVTDPIQAQTFHNDGIDTSSRSSVMDSVKSQLQKINQIASERAKSAQDGY